MQSKCPINSSLAKQKRIPSMFCIMHSVFCNMHVKYCKTQLKATSCSNLCRHAYNKWEQSRVKLRKVEPKKNTLSKGVPWLSCFWCNQDIICVQEIVTTYQLCMPTFKIDGQHVYATPSTKWYVPDSIQYSGGLTSCFAGSEH